MEDSGISTEEFTRLQNQLIELRTQNYEIAEKFKKTNDENGLLQKRIDVKEKELQKASKLMKIPGFGALTKNKNKKSYEEIIEENERLAHQMQRHEEDFNLQNKTLLEEVSRLATENEALSFEFEKLKDSRSREQDENDEIRRIKVENTVLHKKLEELEISRRIPDHLVDQNDSTDNTDNAEIQVDKPNKDFDVQAKSLREIIEGSLTNLFNNSEGDSAGAEEQSTNSNVKKSNNFIEEMILNIEALLGKQSLMSAEDGKMGELKVKFETEQTENKLLMEQLKDERKRSQMDITALKSEIDKLTEKTKRKQESFLHLQEEKEMLHKENRQLEEKLIISKEQYAKSEDRASKFGEELELTRNETENLKQESFVLKEKIEYCSPEKVTELENIINGKNEELMSLKSTLEESASSNQSLMSEVQKLSSEKDDFEEMAKQNNELAMKRKNLLDKLSVERQHELTSHKEELQEARKEFEEQKQILEVCLSDLEKSKREITHTNDRHAELLQNYNSIEKKAGWLERTLKETEVQIETERQENLVVSRRKETEMEESIEAIRVEHLAELQKLSEEKSVVERERDEHVCVIEKLNQAAKDKEIEFRISNKKGDQLLKDLKRQLKTERKRADQIQQRLQDFLTESKCKQTFDELFKPEVSMYKGHRRQDSGSHLSTVSSSSGLELTTDHDNTKSSTPLSGTPLSGASDSFRLNDETIELISKVTDLQLEKNVLEERVRHLEENNSVMVDDLLRKTGIIQSYIRDTKADLHSENARKRSMTLKEKMKDSLHLGKHGKTEDMLKEMNAKMQRLLEETLEKNIQLERDIDFLTKELEKVSKQT